MAVNVLARDHGCKAPSCSQPTLFGSVQADRAASPEEAPKRGGLSTHLAPRPAAPALFLRYVLYALGANLLFAAASRSHPNDGAVQAAGFRAFALLSAACLLIVLFKNRAAPVTGPPTVSKRDTPICKPSIVAWGRHLSLRASCSRCANVNYAD